jgi:hypothetical protein
MTKSNAGTGKSRRQAKPYLEGKGYAIRTRHRGNDIYLSGLKDEKAAMNAASERRREIDKHGAPKGRGADKTTAAQAMQDYAMSRLRFKKGAVQDAVRINHYLRAARLDTLVVTPANPKVRAPGSKPPSAAEKKRNCWSFSKSSCKPIRPNA